MASCYDCGLDYDSAGWIEAIIPDKVWNMIRPDGCGEGGGILCITCIARRLEIMEIGRVPVWLCGTELLRPLPGDPSDFIELLRNWEPK